MNPLAVPASLDAAVARPERRAPASPSRARPAATAHHVRLVAGCAALEPYRAAWERLAAHALDPNVFYEPWQLLPALDAFGDGVEVALVFDDAAGPSPVLRGVFPLERVRRFHGLPVRGLRLWRPLYCYLCTPLVDTRGAAATLGAFLRWLGRGEAGARFMEFEQIRADGPFAAALDEALSALGRASALAQGFERALLRLDGPAAPGDTGLAKKKLKEIGRLRRRLAERGALSVDRLAPDADPGPWIDEFVALEASGWKGDGGSALGSQPATRAFFERIARDAHAAGRLVLLALRLDGRPVAMKCNFVGAAASYAFKIAFDEAFAAYSPGVLLELENMRLLRELTDAPWMDSCAQPDHPMIDHLWRDRRRIESRFVGDGRRLSELAVALYPRLRALKRRGRAIEQERA